MACTMLGMLSRVDADDPDPSAILVVLPTWVGDFVMATPALRAVRRRFSQARITFLMTPNLRDLVEGGDWMDECLEWPTTGGGQNEYKKAPPEPSRDRKGAVSTRMSRPLPYGRGSEKAFHTRSQKHHQSTKVAAQEQWHRDGVVGGYRTLIRELRERRFDLAILLPNSFRAALIGWLSGAKRRVGYDRDGRGFLLTDRIPVKNRKRQWWRCSAARCGKPHPTSIRCGEPHPTPELDGSARRTLREEEYGTPWRPVVCMGANLPVKLSPYEPMPLLEYYADLVKAVGCSRPGDRLELFTTAACDTVVEQRLKSLDLGDHHPLVVISSGARYGTAKCWFPDRFAAVADRLIEADGAAVCITCGPGEEPLARQIAGGMRHRGHVFDRPRLSLGEMKSLVRRCDLLLCNDTGPRHFAKAFSVPVVTVFGPTHPEWTATNYPLERIVRIDVDCGPCQQRVCPPGYLQCMAGVTADAVYSAAAGLLETCAALAAAGRNDA